MRTEAHRILGSSSDVMMAIVYQHIDTNMTCNKDGRLRSWFLLLHTEYSLEALASWIHTHLVAWKNRVSPASIKGHTGRHN